TISGVPVLTGRGWRSDEWPSTGLTEGPTEDGGDVILETPSPAQAPAAWGPWPRRSRRSGFDSPRGHAPRTPGGPTHYPRWGPASPASATSGGSVPLPDRFPNRPWPRGGGDRAVDKPLPETLSATPSPLDEIRARLQRAWQAASPSRTLPRIEDQLRGLADAERRALLPELVALEIAYRRQRGEQPRAEEYRGRFPELSPDWLERAVSPLPQTDTTGPPGPTRSGWTLRCPHCHNPIHLNDAPGDGVLCPGCGGSFRVRAARCTATGNLRRPLGRVRVLEPGGPGGFAAVAAAG